jgi:hypothetical protein
MVGPLKFKEKGLHFAKKEFAFLQKNGFRVRKWIHVFVSIDILYFVRVLLFPQYFFVLSSREEYRMHLFLRA